MALNKVYDGRRRRMRKSRTNLGITADLSSPALGLPFKIKHFLFCPYHSGSIFECVFG
jgi:hypothetical protein